MVPLKHLINFWKTFKMLLIAGSVANQVPTLTINGTKLYVPIMTLSTQKYLNN